MGQFWAIVDATLARNLVNLGKLGESIWADFHWLEELLQSDIEMPKAVLGPSKLVEGNQSSGKRLHDLPGELITVIFEQMTVKDYCYAVMFAHADPFLFECGENHLRKLYRQYHITCAGHRFICIGAHSEDLPDTLCNARELHRIARALDWPMAYTDEEMERLRQRSTSEGGSAAFSDFPPYNHSVVERFDPDDPKLIRDIVIGLYGSPDDPEPGSQLDDCFDGAQIRQIRRFDENALDWLYRPPIEGPIVLRNLSQRLFVRSDTLSNLMVGAPGYGDLGRVMLAHICWSSDASIAMKYWGPINNGGWAGDRLDIVTLKTFGSDAELTTWDDVTESVACTMEEIWKSEFFDEWEEKWQFGD